ncbi:MAG: bifunctional protein : 3-dehydroquinate synthase [Pseudomonadota bacterium]
MNQISPRPLDKTAAESGPHGVRATVQVGLADRSYPIWIGEGLLDQAKVWRQALGPGRSGRPGRVVVVSNEVVMPLYGHQVLAALTDLGCQTSQVVLPDGESHKDMTSLMKIFDHLMAEHVDRSATVVALGGGVIGDMAGFAAACYQRGVDFVQVPTTLLSQVDSSVGGKTAINHPLGKNMIGAFYQPRAVIIDMLVLRTLPAREVSAGLAEIIKYGCILDADFFSWLEANMSALVAKDSAALAYAIERSCQLKAGVVSADERESSGQRALLNFGHTFGHAIEAGMGYGSWLHGEAVGCGMAMAALLSSQLGQLDTPSFKRVINLIHQAGLPLTPPGWPAQDYLDWMAHDKKSSGGAIRYILLKGLGQSELKAVDDALVRTAIEASKKGLASA